MFEEEEWTDNLAAHKQILCVVKPQPPVGKHKAISRLCLKRTLQTLGSAPDWESVIPSADCDEDTEESPTHLFKKKKKKQRCKKQKRTPDTGVNGDVDKDTDKLRKCVKKQQAEHNVSTADVDKGSTEDLIEKRLSRRQWKNKMKNKKRCKNKFLPTSEDVADHKQEGIFLQKLLIKGKTQNIDFRLASLDQDDDGVASSTDASDQAQGITQKAKKDTHRLNALKKTNVRSQRDKEKPLKVDKRSCLQAEKKSFLSIHATEKEEKRSDTQLQQETEDLIKDSERQTDRSSALRSRMEKRLQSARFRYINEQLYTSSSGEARRMFKQDTDAFRIYHAGYSEQIKHWPANPVDSIIAYILRRSSSLVVADFGCGDCKIARSVKNKVHCFDFAPVCDLVTVCDMASVPLGDSTVDIAVFCLSLMGTNLADFLAEANRVLVQGGVLKIAEVASRFADIRQFTGALSRLGFKLVSKDTDNSHFFSFEFLKTQSVPNDVRKIGLELKPCLYKKR